LQRAYLLAANGVVRYATGTPPQRVGACSEHAVLAAGALHWTGVSRPYLRYGNRSRLQNVECISSVSFVGIESNFLQYTGDTDAKKSSTRILKFEFCDF